MTNTRKSMSHSSFFPTERSPADAYRMQGRKVRRIFRKSEHVGEFSFPEKYPKFAEGMRCFSKPSLLVCNNVIVYFVWNTKDGDGISAKPVSKAAFVLKQWCVWGSVRKVTAVDYSASVIGENRCPLFRRNFRNNYGFRFRECGLYAEWVCLVNV